MERIIVKNLSKKFKIGFKKKKGFLHRIFSLFSGKEPQKVLYALRDVSFNVGSGEVLGVIGKNGSGKTTLLQVIADIYPFYEGEKKTIGKVVPLVDLKFGFKRRLSVKDNVFLISSFFGLDRKTTKKKMDIIVEFAGLGNFLETKIYQLSKGMKQRLAFSIAIHSDPKILLLDEIFAVGDEDFRKKSLNRIKQLVRKGICVILVSNELKRIEEFCDKLIWVEKGKIIKQVNNKKDIKKTLMEYKNAK